MKIALVHDWLPFMGGAERVVTNFLEIIYEYQGEKLTIDNILK